MVLLSYIQRRWETRLNLWPPFLPISTQQSLEWVNESPVRAWLLHAWVATFSQTWTVESVNKVQLRRSWIKLVRPLSTVGNTHYARVFLSRQWSNYKMLIGVFCEWPIFCLGQTTKYSQILIKTTLIVPRRPDEWVQGRHRQRLSRWSDDVAGHDGCNRPTDQWTVSSCRPAPLSIDTILQTRYIFYRLILCSIPFPFSPACFVLSRLFAATCPFSGTFLEKLRCGLR